LQTDLNTASTNIASLQETINTAEGDTSALQTTVDGLQTTVNTLQTDVSTAQTTLNALNVDIATAQTAATTATEQATIATEQATIATTKAAEAVVSAESAQTSATAASTGATNAAASATSIAGSAAQINTNTDEIEKAKTDYKGNVQESLNARLIQDNTDLRDDLNQNRMDIEYTGTSIYAQDTLAGYTDGLMVEGFSVANEITNGDFSDGITGLYDEGIVTVANNVASVTTQDASQISRLRVNGLNIVKNTDVMFVYSKCRVTNDECVKIKILHPIIKEFLNPVENEWAECYGKGVCTDSILQIIQYYSDGENTVGKTMEVDGNAGVYVVNMTKWGIEDYTEDQMLEIVRGMQAGTDTQSCVVNEIKSTNGEESTSENYKENIITLDEPITLATGETYTATEQLQTFNSATHITTGSDIPATITASVPTDVPALLASKTSEIDELTTLTTTQETSVANLQTIANEQATTISDTQEVVNNIIPLIL